ncbi:MAG: hypothetical protein RLZZ387_630 [Chloroflexota bacterium]|jgi:uncharacterized protein (TIGR02271 family)
MSDRADLPVITKDGVRGAVVEGMPAGDDTSHVLVRFEDGRQMLVPKSALVQQAEGRYYYLAARIGEVERTPGANAQESADSFTVPVMQEELDIERRRVETGRVRINKLVHEHKETVDEPLIYEQVDVRRVPVDRVVESELEPRTEGDTLIIPVLEEMLVVTKQLVLREELHITMKRTYVHRPETVTLRSEEVQVERVDSQARAVGGGTDHAEGGAL